MDIKYTIKTIEKDFIDKVSAEIQLSADGKDRFLVFTPFHFNDGDQLVIVLKKMGGRWVLSDEAHTYMHLSYYMGQLPKSKDLGLCEAHAKRPLHKLNSFLQ